MADDILPLDQIVNFYRSRDDMSSRMRKIFFAISERYRLSGLVAKAEVHEGHDVHMYLYLQNDPSRVLHVQAYPGMSSDNELCYMARWMDANRLAQIRAEGSCSVGNEHGAVTGSLQELTFATPETLPESDLIKAIEGKSK